MPGGVFEEVFGKRDPSWFEEGDGARPPEGKIASFLSSFDRLVRGKGLGNGTNVGGTDFNHDNFAMGFGFEFGENPLVLPQVGEVPPEGEGGH